MALFSYRIKLILLTLIPLVFATAVLTWMAIDQTERLAQVQAAAFKRVLLQSKKTELKNYMALAYAAIRNVYENAGKNDIAAKREVAGILKNMQYGRDGYFFVYTYKGVCIVHPRLPQLVGKNLWNFRDKDGKLLIQDLIARAKAGGGFTIYRWNQPSVSRPEPKLSYSIGLKRWGWMIGTGVYFDAIAIDVVRMKHIMIDNAKKTLLLMSGISIGSLLMIGFVGLMLNIREARLANKKMLLLAQKTVSFQEKERGRISRELHDGINQLLVSARYKLEGLEVALDKQDEKSAAGALVAIDRILDTGIQDLRRMAHNLRPSVLDDLGLSAAIGSLCSELGERMQIAVNFHPNVKTKQHMEPAIETAVYRIVQEGLNNIEKHCESAQQVGVTLTSRRGWCTVEISDDGAGFDPQAVAMATSSNSGFGLRNMRDRVDLLGGHISIKSSPGRGTTIRIKVPTEGPGKEERPNGRTNSDLVG